MGSTYELDDIGRVVIHSTSNLVGAEITTNHYNDANLVTKQEIYNSGNALVELTYSFTFDHLLRPYQSYLNHIGGVGEILLNKFSYNEQNLVSAKEIHSKDDGTTFLQKLDYSYDAGGRLLGINDLGSLLTEGSCDFDLCNYKVRIQLPASQSSFAVTGLSSINLPSFPYTITATSDGGLIAHLKNWLNVNGYVYENIEVSLAFDDPSTPINAYVEIEIFNTSYSFETLTSGSNVYSFERLDCCIDSQTNTPPDGKDLFAKQYLTTG
jgi:hypothetical protein